MVLFVATSDSSQENRRHRKYRVSQNYVNTNVYGKILICEMCVRALNGTVARWLLCVKHDGEQVETVL